MKFAHKNHPAEPPYWLVWQEDGGAPTVKHPDVVTADREAKRLAVRDDVVGGMPVMESAWEPTPAELAALNNGGKVYLRIVGAGHPPVMVYALGPGNEDGVRHA